MSHVDHVADIAFSTAFGIDKIYPIKPSGSFSVTASGSAGSPEITTESLENPYGVNVLPVMIYSIDNSNWYDGGSPIPSGITTTFGASCYTTSSNLVIVANNFSTSGRTCYYKVIFLAET